MEELERRPGAKESRLLLTHRRAHRLREGSGARHCDKIAAGFRTLHVVGWDRRSWLANSPTARGGDAASRW